MQRAMGMGNPTPRWGWEKEAVPPSPRLAAAVYLWGAEPSDGR